MHIAIIGAGNVGRTLGFAWARRRHHIAFGVRDPAAEQARALLTGARQYQRPHEPRSGTGVRGCEPVHPVGGNTGRH